MDENHTRYSLKAPGRSDSDAGSSLRLPGRHETFPRIDDHLVEPEVTRDEIIRGRRMAAMPAKEPHAAQQSEIDYVLRAHAAPGYLTAVELLTRISQDSDFASDACIYRQGIDPETGQRHLEEIAFEVVSEQSERNVTEKAEEWHSRGVRRVFAVFVKGRRRVCEWSAESRSWGILGNDTQIADACLVKPLPVAALLDAAVADNAVVQALAAKGNPELRRREAAARSEGEEKGRVKGIAEGRAKGKEEGLAEGMARSILRVLGTRGVAVSEAQREEILRCHDPERLGRWLARAVVASSFDEITAES